MRKIRLFTILPLALLCVFMLAACGRAPALERPVGLKYDESAKEIAWNAVSFADGYVVEITGDEGSNYAETTETERAYMDVSALDVGAYEVRVKAVGAGYSDSPWAGPLTVNVVYESGLAYRFINSNTEYEVFNVGMAAEESGRVVIDSTYRGKPVTSIAKNAFYNCTKLIEAVIPDSVTFIGERAFQNCSFLERVVLPNKLDRIGDSVFRNCRSLVDIDIPDSVTEIGASAFSYCNSLTEIKLGNGLKHIGESAFLSCAALKTVETGDGVVTIGESAFEGCGALETVVIGESVTKIDFDAFRSCAALSSVTFGKNLEVIAGYSFMSCASLKSVAIPDSVTEIGESAFENCGALLSVEIGEGVRHIGRYAFNNTAAWIIAVALSDDGVYYLDGWALGSREVTSGRFDVTIKSGTVGVGNAAFAVDAAASTGVQSVRKITIPQTVKYIDDYAFYNCVALTDVTFTGCPKYIGDYSFADCPFLENLTFGADGLESVGSSAFVRCTALKVIPLPDTVRSVGAFAFYETGAWRSASGVVYVGKWAVGLASGSANGAIIQEGTVGISDQAFYDVKSLVSVTFPSTLKIIGRNAFNSCLSLKSVNIPSELTEIGDYAFYYCIALESFSAGSVKSIGRSVFYLCENLKEVRLPNIESIGPYAFYSCTSLGFVNLGSSLKELGEKAFLRSGIVSVTIPGSLSRIGEKAFMECESLTSVDIEEGVESIGRYAFGKCVHLSDIELAPSVKHIEDYAFRNCFALKDIDLTSVRTIGDYAFIGCTSLTNLVLGESVEAVGKHAFRGCSALSSAVIADSVTEIGINAFYGCNNLTVYAEAAARPVGWSARWNSSLRPVFWGSALSESKDFVVSVVKSGLENSNISNSLSSPSRKGKEFGGWALSAGGGKHCDTSGIDELADDVALYAVWN